MPKKPTTARRKRAVSKSATAAEAEKPEGGNETPVDYMLRVMRDPSAKPERRDTMAKSATPYIHARPAAKKKRARNGEASLKKRLEAARETLAGKIAGLGSEGG